MKLKLAKSITDFSPSRWDRVVDPDFPFYSYHFLEALETTDCLGSRTGWYPLYLAVMDGEEILAATVVYEKTNSWGEYIFDFAWANAHHAYGLRYYPKVVLAVPFTPATGAKLLFAPNVSAAERTSAGEMLFAAIGKFSDASEASSVHALFIPQAEIATFEAAGYFTRTSFQFHWLNDGYADFDDFLAKLRSKRRHELKREREQVVKNGITLERLTGEQLNPELADLFYQFYIRTIDKKASYDYLSSSFFKKVFANLKSNLLLVLARDATGEPVAGALNYFGGQTLYGRNWGCLAEYRSLHFEVCYHQGIEFAIERGLARFEAGAQGEHKFNRGFLPVKTFSAHKLSSPKLDPAVRTFVDDERRAIERTLKEMESHSPFARVSK